MNAARPIRRRPNAATPERRADKSRVTAHLSVVDRTSSPDLATRLGVRRSELDAVANLARRTLLCGGLKAARDLFEGLVELAPTDAHFALGLGLAYDRLGAHEDAHQLYRRAAALDPMDGHADVNRAELFLAHGDRVSAKKLLARGLDRAERSSDLGLADKARALLRNLERKSS